MNQQPDKFFRDKLHGYGKSVSAEAWKRVSENMEKKNKTPWLRIAAAILLLATGTLWIYPIIRRDAALVAQNNASQNTNPTVISPVPDEKPSDKDKQPARTVETVPPAKDKNDLSKNRSPLKNGVPRNEAVMPATMSQDDKPVIASDQHKDANDGAASKNLPTEETEVTIAERVQPKHVTIVFTAEEVNQKYLTKNTDAEATSEQRETSRLKKLLDKAYDLTHNQDPLGGLRQKKNEILAMNFKSDKQRTQND